MENSNMHISQLTDCIQGEKNILFKFEDMERERDYFTLEQKDIHDVDNVYIHVKKSVLKPFYDSIQKKGITCRSSEYTKGRNMFNNKGEGHTIVKFKYLGSISSYYKCKIDNERKPITKDKINYVNVMTSKVFHDDDEKYIYLLCRDIDENTGVHCSMCDGTKTNELSKCDMCDNVLCDTCERTQHDKIKRVTHKYIDKFGHNYPLYCEQCYRQWKKAVIERNKIKNEDCPICYNTIDKKHMVKCKECSNAVCTKCHDAMCENDIAFFKKYNIDDRDLIVNCPICRAVY